MFASLFVILTGTGSFAQMDTDKMEKKKREYLGIYCRYQTALEDHWIAQLQKEISDEALDAIKKKAVRDKNYKPESLPDTLSALLRQRGRAIYKKKRTQRYLELMEKFLFQENLGKSYKEDLPSQKDCEDFLAVEAERREKKALAEAELREKNALAEAEGRELEMRQRQVKVERVLAKSTTAMVHIPGGSFTMGCTLGQRNCDDDEEPAHQVQLKSFQIGKYEVTQELWGAVMHETPYGSGNCLECPVANASWKAVQAFLEKLNGLTGEQYRLPTEAEWEYAARGGEQSKGYEYAGSNEPDSVAWHKKNSGKVKHPVGQKQPNELGLYDMSGNVKEWVQDCWNMNYVGAPSDGSAWEQGHCGSRVARGGSSYDEQMFIRLSNRSSNVTSITFQYNMGFRLARTLP